MDGNAQKPRGGNKAARPAPATQQQVAPDTPALCDDDDATASQVDVAQPDVASVDESHGTKVEDNRDDDDDDDEQVERFYALLANIRAMRGLLPLHNMVASSSACGGGSGGDNDAAGDSTTTKKRLRRSAEPPWRPVFKMEDFEERPSPSSASCKISKRTRGAAGHGESSG